MPPRPSVHSMRNSPTIVPGASSPSFGDGDGVPVIAVTSFLRSLIPNDYYSRLMTLIAELVAAVHRHALPGGGAWLDAQLSSISRTSLPPAFAAAGRKLGQAAISEEVARGIGIPWPATG